MTDSPFAVGDHVTRHTGTRYGTTQTGTIVSIARRWMTVDLENGCTERFDKITGKEDSGQYAPQAFVETDAMGDERIRREAARDRMHKLTPLGWYQKLDADTLEQIADILEAAHEARP